MMKNFYISIVLLSAISTYGQDVGQFSPYVGPRNSYPGWSNDGYNDRLNEDQKNLFNNYFQNDRGENFDREVPVPQFGDNFNNFAGGDNRLRNGPQISFSPPPPPPNQNQPWQESYNYPSNDGFNYNNYGNNDNLRRDNDNERRPIFSDGRENLYKLGGDQGLDANYGNDFGQNSQIDSTDLTNVNNDATTSVDTTVDTSSNSTTTS